MVSKGFRLWAMGQLDSACRAPPRLHRAVRLAAVAGVLLQRVCPTTTSADWTKTKTKPRHWFTRCRQANGRHAQLHATLPSRRTPGGAAARTTPAAAL
jgi:hypothetical protein